MFVEHYVIFQENIHSQFRYFVPEGSSYCRMDMDLIQDMDPFLFLIRHLTIQRPSSIFF